MLCSNGQMKFWDPVEEKLYIFYTIFGFFFLLECFLRVVYSKVNYIAYYIGCQVLILLVNGVHSKYSVRNVLNKCNKQNQ